MFRTSNPSAPRSIFKLLGSPWLLAAMFIVGILIGTYSPMVTKLIAPLGEIYIGLLKMVILPFLLVSVMVGVAKLFDVNSIKMDYFSLFATFLIMTCLTSFLGVAVTQVLQPGRQLASDSRKALGEILSTSPYSVDMEITLDSPPKPPAPSATFSDALQTVIPANIFNALNDGKTIEIMFFAMVFGISLGKSRMDEKNALKDALVSVYAICVNILDVVNMLLPFAFCALIANQVSITGLRDIFAMWSFVLVFTAICAGVICIAIAIVVFRYNGSARTAIAAMGDPLFTACATRSSISSLPSAMEAMYEKLNFDRDKVQLLLPLTMTLCRFGPMLYFGSASVFIAQLHNVDLTLNMLLWIFFMTWIAGFASAGTTGVLTISVLGTIVRPIGLPLDAALVLFIAVDPLLDVFRTAAIVIPNCAMVAILSPSDSKRDQQMMELPAPGE